MATKYVDWSNHTTNWPGLTIPPLGKDNNLVRLDGEDVSNLPITSLAVDDDGNGWVEHYTYDTSRVGGKNEDGPVRTRKYGRVEYEPYPVKPDAVVTERGTR